MIIYPTQPYNDIQNSSLNNAAQTAVNGLQQIDVKLNSISKQIAETTTSSQNVTHQTFSIEEIQALSKPSLEENLVGLTQNKNQALSLLKVLEVEKQLFDDALGRIFDEMA